MRQRLILWLIAVFWSAGVTADSGPIRIGVTPAIVHDDYLVMMDLRQYLERKTARVVELVPRNSYRETIDLIKHGQLDFAWVSAYSFVYSQHNLKTRLLAVPVIDGHPYFRSYLIVPASDLITTSLAQMEGKIFAYADPYSYTGYLLPRYELRRVGKNANTFFAKAFFAWGHKKVIRAVASGLADGAYVNSFVWDSLAVSEPELTVGTRIVTRSAECGSPPLIASGQTSEQDFMALRRVLFDMSADPEGVKLLKRLHLDGFVAGDAKAYANVARMMHVMGEL